MCLCNGTGRVVIEHEWGYHMAPCPDTNCTHDRVGAIERFDKWAEETLRDLDEIGVTTA